MAKKAKKAKGGKDAASKGGLDDALGVGVAAVALIAGAGAAASRQLKTRTNGGEPPADTAPVVQLRPTPEPKPPKGIKAKILGVAERFPPLLRAIEVQERYGDLHGNNLAAAVTFQAFVSLFPLLLVAVAVIGFVAGDGTNVAGRVIAELGLNGDAAEAVRDAVDSARESKRAASALGLVSLLWSGLGLVNALQYAYNQVWQVEARGIKDKAVGVLWLGGAAVIFVAAAAITTLLRWLPGYFAPLAIVIVLAVNFGLWVWTSKV